MIDVDEAAARITREPAGLVLEHAGERFTALVARPAFPWSSPGTHIVLLAGDEARALIVDPSRLDPASRAALHAALAEHRFLPRILKVESMSFSRNLYLWQVQTDRGPRTFRTRHGWGEEPVLRVPGGALVISATDGVRYRIDDPAGLPEAERRLLAPLL